MADKAKNPKELLCDQDLIGLCGPRLAVIRWERGRACSWHGSLYRQRLGSGVRAGEARRLVIDASLCDLTRRSDVPPYVPALCCLGSCIFPNKSMGSGKTIVELLSPAMFCSAPR